MTEHFPKLMADTKPQIQEVQRTLSKMYREKITPRYILFKLQKTKGKEKILKQSWRKKYLTYKRTKIMEDFLSEPLHEERE